MERKRKFNDQVLLPRLEKIKNTLGTKAKEYSHQDDPFHNFNQVAAIENISPVKAAWAMMLKHFVSVQDMVHGRRAITKEALDEKIGDVMCYMVLIEGMLGENVVKSSGRWLEKMPLGELERNLKKDDGKMGRGGL